jgi:pimeloyl-ACP methyl ester carboxylesterase
MRQIVYELHTLLEKAGVRPPYVLVGQSFGAWPVRLYASTYPAEVAGMVLVEGGFDNPWRLASGGKLVRSAELATGKPIPPVNTSTPLRESDVPPEAMRQMKAGAEKSVPRANEPPRDKLPAAAQSMRTWALSRWQHYAAGFNPVEHEELAALRADRNSREYPLGSMPLVVMTRGLSDEDGPDGKSFTEERKKEHAELAKMSRAGKQVIATHSGHHIQIDEPELVASTIREVLAATRK